MCEDKNDCECKHRHHHYGRPRHLGEGFSSIVKRTSEDVEVPDELLEVAEIKQGDFLKISVLKVIKPSEWKEYKHYKD